MKAYDARKKLSLITVFGNSFELKKNRKVYETVVKVAWGA